MNIFSSNVDDDFHTIQCKQFINSIKDLLSNNKNKGDCKWRPKSKYVNTFVYNRCQVTLEIKRRNTTHFPIKFRLSIK